MRDKGFLKTGLLVLALVAALAPVYWMLTISLKTDGKVKTGARAAAKAKVHVTASGPRLQPTLFELSKPGRNTDKVPHPPRDALDRLPGEHRRTQPASLPDVNEPEAVRHYVNLSQLNHAVDTGFYPLGSCTMKWNPKVNEWAARLPGFAQLHPMAPDAVAQGTLQLLWELEQMLIEISGMRAVTLQPAAGAHGELTGILMVRAYHESRGDLGRTDVLVPDSAHGTNPATATMAGLKAVSIKAAADPANHRYTPAAGRSPSGRRSRRPRVSIRRRRWKSAGRC